ncbi:helix-turn-helix domain-containing protein [Asanoa sp. NPDC049518]|uniref:ArsR/SmtB family transcription factor n=1 Tax=unclassified Asanoa TaxID=2685164 RepID=UPI00342BD89B
MAEVGQERRQITDPKMMRALAHPARLAILEHLNSTGEPTTATEFAEIVGLSPSATSYHLRELAKVNMIEEAPSRGDGRERVWQSPVHSFQIDLEQGRGDPEARAAEDALMAVYLERDQARLRTFLSRARDEPQEWRDAAGLTSSTIFVTADELKTFLEQVHELIDPLKRRHREAPPDGARTVRVHFAAFPDD